MKNPLFFDWPALQRPVGGRAAVTLVFEVHPLPCAMNQLEILVDKLRQTVLQPALLTNITDVYRYQWQPIDYLKFCLSV